MYIFNWGHVTIYISSSIRGYLEVHIKERYPINLLNFFFFFFWVGYLFTFTPYPESMVSQKHFILTILIYSHTVCLVVLAEK